MLREHGADWLDAPDQAAITAVFVTVDEGDDYVSGRSISPREKTGSSLEDLIGAPQFSSLALEALNFSVFLAGGAAPSAVIHRGATHPPANRLRSPHPQLLGHHLHRRELRAVVVAGLEHHPHRTVTELLRIILYRSCHRLDRSKKSSLRTRREGSGMRMMARTAGVRLGGLLCPALRAWGADEGGGTRNVVPPGPRVRVDVRALGLSPGGERVAAPCGARIWGWNADDGSIDGRLSGDAILARGPEDSLIASTGGNANIVLLDPDSGKHPARLSGHE